MKRETPLEAYYRRIKAIRRGDKTIWVEIGSLSVWEQGQYEFFRRWGDKTFEQIVNYR